jgi:hypothetical protein
VLFAQVVQWRNDAWLVAVLVKSAVFPCTGKALYLPSNCVRFVEAETGSSAGAIAASAATDVQVQANVNKVAAIVKESGKLSELRSEANDGKVTDSITAADGSKPAGLPHVAVALADSPPRPPQARE